MMILHFDVSRSYRHFENQRVMGGSFSKTCCGPRNSGNKNTETTRTHKITSPYTPLIVGIEAKSGKDWWKPPPSSDFAEKDVVVKGEKIGQTTLSISFEDVQMLLQSSDQEYSLYRIALRGTPKNEKLKKKYDISEIPQPHMCKTSNWRWNDKKWTRTIRYKVPIPSYLAIGSMIYSNWPKDNVSDVIECWYLTRSEKKWTIHIYTHAEPIDDMRSIRTIEITKRNENSCDIELFIRFERRDPDSSPFLVNMMYPSVELSMKRMFFVFDHSITTNSNDILYTHTHTHKSEISACQFEDASINVLSKLRMSKDGKPTIV